MMSTPHGAPSAPNDAEQGRAGGGDEPHPGDATSHLTDDVREALAISLGNHGVVEPIRMDGRQDPDDRLSVDEPAGCAGDEDHSATDAIVWGIVAAAVERDG